MIDGHQRTIEKPHDEIAGIGDASNAVEGKTAGKHDDDAERTENLVANGHLENSGAPLNQSVTFTIIFMRGWIAQSTCTSPASLKVTSVAAPGACEPRLNSLPLLVERMLCGMVSSLTKVSASPFLIVTFSAEKTLPF